MDVFLLLYIAKETGVIRVAGVTILAQNLVGITGKVHVINGATDEDSTAAQECFSGDASKQIATIFVTGYEA
jgi:hypothetical protein